MPESRVTSTIYHSSQALQRNLNNLIQVTSFIQLKQYSPLDLPLNQQKDSQNWSWNSWLIGNKKLLPSTFHRFSYKKRNGQDLLMSTGLGDIHICFVGAGSIQLQCFVLSLFFLRLFLLTKTEEEKLIENRSGQGSNSRYSRWKHASFHKKLNTFKNGSY